MVTAQRDRKGVLKVLQVWVCSSDLEQNACGSAVVHGNGPKTGNSSTKPEQSDGKTTQSRKIWPVLVRTGSPRQLPQRKQDAQLVVQLQEVIKSPEDELRLGLSFSLKPDHVRLQGHVHTLGHEQRTGQTDGRQTDIVLVRVVSLLEGENGGVQDAAVLLQRVDLRGEGQDGLVVGRQAGEAQLGQVVDEEVELGGHAAETGLDQPAGGDRERKLRARCPLLDQAAHGWRVDFHSRPVPLPQKKIPSPPSPGP